MEDKKLIKLKTLVSEKLYLEKEQKLTTPEWKVNKQNIDKLVNGLLENEIKYLKKLCEQENENYVNFYNSDIENAQRKIMDKKMNVILTCSDLLNQKLTDNQNDVELEK